MSGPEHDGYRPMHGVTMNMSYEPHSGMWSVRYDPMILRIMADLLLKDPTIAELYVALGPPSNVLQLDDRLH